jgi:hypothetical protein
VAMAPRPHGFDLSVFDSMWEEIKAISKSPLKSYGYRPYIMHMIKRVAGHTFGCDKEHHSLRIKNDLRAPVEERRAAARHASPPRAARGEGSRETRPHLLFRRSLASSLECVSPNMLQMWGLNMKGAKERKSSNQ